jgi:hypothetical protein
VAIERLPYFIIGGDDVGVIKLTQSFKWWPT